MYQRRHRVQGLRSFPELPFGRSIPRLGRNGKIALYVLFVIGIMIISSGAALYFLKFKNKASDIIPGITESIKETTWKEQIDALKKKLAEIEQSIVKDREGAILRLEDFKKTLKNLEQKAGDKEDAIGKVIAKTDQVIESLRSNAEGIGKKIEEFGKSIDTLFSEGEVEQKEHLY